MANYKYVLYEKDEGVAVITLNRPERRNALGSEIREGLNAALQDARDDDEIRAIVVTGAGTAWSAGADVQASRPGAGRQWHFGTLEGSLKSAQKQFLDHLWIHFFPKPIIAAVNGYCLGVAFELCLNMDIIIASEEASFGAPEVKHGSTDATRAPFIIGSQMAKRLYLTGERIDAKEAYRIGLVTEVVPADKLMETAIGLAKRIAKVPRHAVMMNKLMIDGVVDDMGFMNGTSRSTLYSAMCHYLMTQPHTESAKLFETLSEKGAKAFIDERETRFKPEE